MAVTFARTGYTVGTTDIDAPSPLGSGGRIVVAAMGRTLGTVAPDTSGDWSSSIDSTTWAEAGVRAWVSTSATPDLGFTVGASQEVGMYSVRIDDASGTYASATGNSSTFATDPVDLPDVSSAPAGVAIAFLGLQNSGTVDSWSVFSTEHYEGDCGASGWFARDCAVATEEGVSSGTFDAGTFTPELGELTNHLVIVMETSAAGGSLIIPQRRLHRARLKGVR